MPGWDRFKLKGSEKKSFLSSVCLLKAILSLSETSNKVSWTAAKSSHPVLLCLVAKSVSSSCLGYFSVSSFLSGVSVSICIADPSFASAVLYSRSFFKLEVLSFPHGRCNLPPFLEVSTLQLSSLVKDRKVVFFGAWPLLLFLKGDIISNINYEQTSYALFLLSWYCKKDRKKLLWRWRIGCERFFYGWIQRSTFLFLICFWSFLHLCFHCYLCK